tara:strand:+ start:32 stop:304 length:273 start_codon:yes stop_codon:yes gene_type:complete
MSSNRYKKSQSTMIKFSNIPEDLESSELRHLINEWAPSGIGKVFIVRKEWGCYGMVEFRNESEADYAIKALHKTKFDKLIIELEKLPNRY